MTEEDYNFIKTIYFMSKLLVTSHQGFIAPNSYSQLEDVHALLHSFFRQFFTFLGMQFPHGQEAFTF